MADFPLEDLNDTSNDVQPVQGNVIGESKKKNLLELAKKSRIAAAVRMVSEWNGTKPEMSNHFAQWTANKARYEGLSGVRCVKVKDEKTCRIPMMARTVFAGMNLARRLSLRISAQIWSDPPLPEVEPTGNDDESRDAAQFSTRVALTLGGEDQLDLAGKGRRATERGMIYGSGFEHFFIDPKGNGHRATQIQAYSSARTTEDALEIIDPEMGGFRQGELIVRFVREDGTLTDEKSEARRTWLPRIRDELLTGKHVRFIPSYAEMEEADGMMIGAMVQYGVVKSLFPELMKLSGDERDKIITARPHGTDALLPPGKKDRLGEITDDSFVFVLTRYHRAGAEYTFGAHLITIGEDYLAWPPKEAEEFDGEWYDRTHDEPLEIPVTQYGLIDEEDNPYKVGFMETLGPANDIRNNILGSHINHLKRFDTIKTFVPMMSNITAEQMQSPTNTYIPVVQGGKPEREELPNFPRAANEFLSFTTTEMQDESALQQTAQGLESTNVNSGRQAQQIIEQTHANLSGVIANLKRGYIRGTRIVLQMARAFYTIPQQIEWQGDDGAYKQRQWVGSDLTTTKNIRIKRGSFTQLQPTVKTLLASEQVQLGAMTVQEFEALVEGNVQSLTGLQNNPHRLRVRRQINAFLEGPPEGWQFNPGEPQQDPETSEEIPPSALQDPVLGTMFQSLPMDLEPEVAALRTFEMGRAMAGTKYGSKPPEWRQGLAEAYRENRQAAGILTIEEQAQQAQAEQEAKQQEVQTQQEAQQTQQDTKLQEAEIKANTEIQKTEIAAEAKREPGAPRLVGVNA